MGPGYAPVAGPGGSSGCCDACCRPCCCCCCCLEAIWPWWWCRLGISPCTIIGQVLLVLFVLFVVFVILASAFDDAFRRDESGSSIGSPAGAVFLDPGDTRLLATSASAVGSAGMATIAGLQATTVRLLVPPTTGSAVAWPPRLVTPAETDTALRQRWVHSTSLQRNGLSLAPDAFEYYAYHLNPSSTVQVSATCPADAAGGVWVYTFTSSADYDAWAKDVSSTRYAQRKWCRANTVTSSFTVPASVEMDFYTVFSNEDIWNSASVSLAVEIERSNYVLDGLVPACADSAASCAVGFSGSTSAPSVVGVLDTTALPESDDSQLVTVKWKLATSSSSSNSNESSGEANEEHSAFVTVALVLAVVIAIVIAVVVRSRRSAAAAGDASSINNASSGGGSGSFPIVATNGMPVPEAQAVFTHVEVPVARYMLNPANPFSSGSTPLSQQATAPSKWSQAWGSGVLVAPSAPTREEVEQVV